ncbi:MAG: hypothetical protein LBM92_04435, partial [Opitutaceae bacterium]|nr:hypothetical protein [Opitutaceae bacterium]
MRTTTTASRRAPAALHRAPALPPGSARVSRATTPPPRHFSAAGVAAWLWSAAACCRFGRASLLARHAPAALPGSTRILPPGSARVSRAGLGVPPKPLSAPESGGKPPHSMTTPPSRLSRVFQGLLSLAFAAGAIAPAANAANVYWADATGTWFTPNGWHDNSVTGAARNAPAAADNAYIESGRVAIGSGVTASSAVSYVGALAGSSGTAVVENGGLWNVNGAFN